MVQPTSKRADILKALLPHISRGHYDVQDDYIVFGAPSIWEMIDDLTDFQDSNEDHGPKEALKKWVSDRRLLKGREQLTGRIDLNEPRKLVSGEFQKLSEDQILNLLFQVTEALERGKNVPGHTSTSTSADAKDSIDAALAEEFLGKLPKAVDRTMRLPQMSLDQVPNEDIRRYFGEAHHCYIYGFKIACAVLCRALLEEALKQICERHGLAKIYYDERDPKFMVLVDKAIQGGLLRKDGSRDKANQVRKAGNDAVHQPAEFKKVWENKLDKVLKDTRETLLDLYSH